MKSSRMLVAAALAAVTGVAALMLTAAPASATAPAAVCCANTFCATSNSCGYRLRSECSLNGVGCYMTDCGTGVPGCLG